MKLIRIGTIDAVRGICVIMMIIYHIMFDLRYFGIMEIDLQFLPILLFQRAIGTGFLIVAGISMWISEAGHKTYDRHFQRFLKLSLVAAAITLATWIYPHQSFISFGIIHLMAFSALLGPLFFRLGKWNLPLGLAIIALGSLPPGLESDFPYLFWLGFPDPEYTALDYYPLIPWFGAVLIGIYAGQNAMKKLAVSLPFGKSLEWIGRNSLAIYVLHQPVIIGIIWIAMAMIE